MMLTTFKKLFHCKQDPGCRKTDESLVKTVMLEMVKGNRSCGKKE